MDKRQRNSRRSGSCNKPHVLFEHPRVKVYATDDRCWVEIDGLAITQGIASEQRIGHGNDTHLVNMGRSFVRLIDKNWVIKVGKNGRLYPYPPRPPGKRPGSHLTDMDVLAALREAIHAYRETREWDAEFELTIWHLKRRGLEYDTNKWSGTAPMIYVVYAIRPDAYKRDQRATELRHTISGKLRRLRSLKLVDYRDATGQLACAKRPDDAFASKMWFITSLGYETLAIRERQQRDLIERAINI